MKETKTKNELIDEKMHLVWEIARKYKEKAEYKNIPISVLVEAGTNTLIKIISSDSFRGYDFTHDEELEASIELAAFMYQLAELKDPAKKARLCLEAIKENDWALEYVPDELKTAEFCLKAVKENGWALEYVPEHLKTAELCLEAVKQMGGALEYVPDKFKTYGMYLEAVKKRGDLLRLVPENLKIAELCNVAVKQYGYALQYVPDELKTAELYLEAIKNDSLVFRDVPENIKTAKFCLEAVKKNVRTLFSVPEKFKTYGMCLEAVKQNGRLFFSVPEKFHTYEMCFAAVKQSGDMLEYMRPTVKTEELCLEAVKQNLDAEAVKQNLDALRYVPEKFKTASFWLELVKMDARLLYEVPEEFKTVDMFIEAVKQEYWMFMLVPESLKEQVLEATGIQKRTAKTRPKNISAKEKEFFKKEVERICIKIIEFGIKARREGILALKEYIDKKQLSKKALLETGLKMAVDGKEHKIIKKYMDSRIKANCVTHCEKILASIIKTGVLCIQAGVNPRAVEYEIYKITALIPRDLIPDTLVPTIKNILGNR